MTILEKVQALIGPAANAHTQQISALVEICQQDACDYCNLAEYATKLDNVVVQW